MSNFSLLRHRDYTGFLVSMHQSGTHWLKHMLAVAIADQYGLAPPRYSHANDIIGGVHDGITPARGPRLVSSHSIPHLLIGSRWLRRLVVLPPYVVLVRDIRATLVANWEKWKEHYGCTFSEFLRGDMGGRRFNSDLWWCIRFCNAWGRVAHRLPAQTLIVRYEELQRDPLPGLAAINTFWRLGLSDAALRAGVRESSKDKMAAKRDPDTPAGVTVVRRDDRPAADWFNAEDRVFLTRACRDLLRHDLGYDYGRWPASSA